MYSFQSVSMASRIDPTNLLDPKICWYDDDDDNDDDDNNDDDANDNDDDDDALLTLQMSSTFILPSLCYLYLYCIYMLVNIAR